MCEVGQCLVLSVDRRRCDLLLQLALVGLHERIWSKLTNEHGPAFVAPHALRFTVIEIMNVCILLVVVYIHMGLCIDIEIIVIVNIGSRSFMYLRMLAL